MAAIAAQPIETDSAKPMAMDTTEEVTTPVVSTTKPTIPVVATTTKATQTAAKKITRTSRKPTTKPRKKKSTKNNTRKKTTTRKKKATGKSKKKSPKGKKAGRKGKGKSPGTKTKLKAKVRGRKKKPTRRIVSSRKIITGPKTPWINFCNVNRLQVMAEHPNESFGGVCKILAPRWKNATAEQKQPYIKMYEADKLRYKKEFAALSEQQLKDLRSYKRERRKQRKERPANPLSEYMFYVRDKRQQIVTENPHLSFTEIGVVLGQQWNKLTDDQKAPYRKANQEDKARYKKETVIYLAQKAAEVAKRKQQREEQRKARELQKEAAAAKVAMAAATTPQQIQISQ